MAETTERLQAAADEIRARAEGLGLWSDEDGYAEGYRAGMRAAAGILEEIARREAPV